MNKADLIAEVEKRTGLNKAASLRGVEATLAAIKISLEAEDSVLITDLGRLELKPKRSGLLPPNGTGPRPIPSGKAVRLKATRKGVAILNTEPQSNSEIELTIGGKMDKKNDNSNEVTPTTNSALGLDVGTSRLVLANGSAESVKTNAELNAFVSVPYSKFTENILKQNNVTYQLNGGSSLQIFGNEAARFANFFNAEVRRPMLNGTLNPTEEYSLPVMEAIVEQLIKKTKRGENLRFSVPGPLRDGGSTDLVYHEAMLQNMLESLGYNARAINEGMAVVYSELESENFSGIGISCGGGMCNVALAFMSLPVLTFSIGKAGDYIDRSVASVTGETPTRIRAIKEEGIDLIREPRNKYESALQVYYEDVILSLVEGLRGEIAATKNLPKIEKPIPIVVSGGTAKPKGFIDRFRQTIERDGFPLPLSDIRLADAPLTATARGCLIAALYDA
ncbi:MAG: hypothetical protein DMF61_13255 [Blastocatellia bacterium AA13]|nr:MAG: hypothetical protein DMF61_13255 [Blastocatellia bacterium AA13]